MSTLGVLNTQCFPLHPSRRRRVVIDLPRRGSSCDGCPSEPMVTVGFEKGAEPSVGQASVVVGWGSGWAPEGFLCSDADWFGSFDKCLSGPMAAVGRPLPESQGSETSLIGPWSERCVVAKWGRVCAPEAFLCSDADWLGDLDVISVWPGNVFHSGGGSMVASAN